MLWEAGSGFCRAEGNFAGKREWLGPERGMTAGDGRGRAGMERALPRCCRPVGNIGNCRSAGKRPSALPGNDLLKDALLRAQLKADNVPCHLVGAFGAGFCATVVASAVDVVKTRYMKSGPGQYRNALSCLLALLMQDGPAGLSKGFVPSFLRLGSWNAVMFVSYEQLQRAMALARPGLA